MNIGDNQSCGARGSFAAVEVGVRVIRNIQTPTFCVTVISAVGGPALLCNEIGVDLLTNLGFL